MPSDAAEATARTDFVLPLRDPDLPFAFADYVAIASTVRHHGTCTVWPSTLPCGLPYGMWWQELRPQIELGEGEPPLTGAPLDGVWESTRRWIGREHDDYAAVVEAYRVAAWLDHVDRATS